MSLSRWEQVKLGFFAILLIAVAASLGNQFGRSFGPSASQGGLPKIEDVTEPSFSFLFDKLERQLGTLGKQARYFESPDKAQISSEQESPNQKNKYAVVVLGWFFVGLAAFLTLFHLLPRELHPRYRRPWRYPV